MIPPLQFDSWQWLSLALAAPVVVWGGLPFHRAAWMNLRHGAATMDTLISLGVLAAFGWSLYALFLGDAGEPGMTMTFKLIPERGAGTDELYLEIASAVTVFILAGRYLEARAKGRAGAALTALLELGAKDVSVLGRRRQRAPHPRRGARRRRPLRRAPGREDRHRRRRRGGFGSRRPVAADGRVGAGREAARVTPSRAPGSTRAGVWSCAPPASAPTPRWPRSPAW